MKVEHGRQVPQKLIENLEQRFQTGGSRAPGGPKQDFRGSEMRFSRLRVGMLLDVCFFKRTEIYERLQVLLLKRTLSRLAIPANVTDSTI